VVWSAPLEASVAFRPKEESPRTVICTVFSVRPTEWQRWWRWHGAKELRSLLLEHWDPIGVRNSPGAWDEYDSYMLPLVRKLRSGADAGEVAGYLAAVQSASMGLPATPDALRAVADRLVTWYANAMTSSG
jgi:cytochrome P450